ncbi:MAG: CvpA family protein [Myxococcota bacterium]
MEPLAPVDLVVAAILGIALLRGLFLGLIREAFSIGALAAAVLAVRLFLDPATAWLDGWDFEWLPAVATPWVAGAGLALAALVAVNWAGAVIRKGARAVGLGWADRLGGAALGFAEGAIVAGVLLVVLGSFFGRDHQFLARSQSLAWLEQLEGATGNGASGADVAAPPRG